MTGTRTIAPSRSSASIRLLWTRSWSPIRSCSVASLPAYSAAFGFSRTPVTRVAWTCVVPSVAGSTIVASVPTNEVLPTTERPAGKRRRNVTIAAAAAVPLLPPGNRNPILVRRRPCRTSHPRTSARRRSEGSWIGGVAAAAAVPLLPPGNRNPILVRRRPCRTSHPRTSARRRSEGGRMGWCWTTRVSRTRRCCRTCGWW
jgi:hypothetical protein